MRKILLLPLIVTMFWSTTSNAWRFWNSDDGDNDDNQQQQIDNLQDQLDQQTHANSQLHIVIIILSTGVVVALVVGAAVGSKARKAAKEVEN